MMRLGWGIERSCLPGIGGQPCYEVWWGGKRLSTGLTAEALYVLARGLKEIIDATVSQEGLEVKEVHNAAQVYA